jgi:hypothetical protein
MTAGTSALIAVAMTTSLLAFQAPAAPGRGAVPGAAQVQPALVEFERRLLEGQSTRELLAPTRTLLATAVRKVPWAAKSWQLEPSLLPDLSDAELFDFISLRADAVLSCSLEIYSRFAAEEVPADARSLFWSTDSGSGAIRVSPDCSELVDARSEPIRLRNRSDFLNALNVQRTFDSGIRAKGFSASIAKAPLVGENLSYLKREYGTPPQEEAEMRAALGAPVYSGITATLQSFFIEQNGRPIPFFVAPLSH